MRNLLFLAAFFVLLSSCNRKLDEEINYDAAYVINGGDNSITVIDLTSLTVKETWTLRRANYPHHIYLSPDKTLLAVSAPGVDLSAGHQGTGGHGGHGNKGRILLLNAKNLKCVEKENMNSGAHNAIFSANGERIWTAVTEDGKGEVQVYDTKKMKLEKSIQVGDTPLEITFNSAGNRAFVCNTEGSSVSVLDVDSYEVLATIAVGSHPVGAWPGADNHMYVDNEAEKTISVIDATSLLVTETITLGFTPGYVALNSTSGELWVSDSDNGSVHYYAHTTGTWVESGSVATGAGAHAIAISRDGTTVYVTNQSAATVSVIDAVSKTKRIDIAVGNNPNGIVLRYN